MQQKESQNSKIQTLLLGATLGGSTGLLGGPTTTFLGALIGIALTWKLTYPKVRRPKATPNLIKPQTIKAIRLTLNEATLAHIVPDADADSITLNWTYKQAKIVALDEDGRSLPFHLKLPSIYQVEAHLSMADLIDAEAALRSKHQGVVDVYGYLNFAEDATAEFELAELDVHFPGWNKNIISEMRSIETL